LERLDGSRVVEQAAQENIRLYATGPREIRFVTHHDVDDEDVARLLDFLGSLPQGSDRAPPRHVLWKRPCDSSTRTATCTAA
jgi:hypothetical protein